MANNYYSGTGELTLVEVTPVVQALFGAFSIQKQEDGTAYIRKIAEEDSTYWSDVADSIVAVFGKKLKLSDADGADSQPEASDVLGAFLELFNVTDPAFMNLVEHLDESTDAELDDLLAIALACDDGHGLSSVKFEGCWSCDKPRLFEFGGNGAFHSSAINIWATSTNAIRLGEVLDAALKANDIAMVASTLKMELRSIVTGIKNEDQRNAVLAALKLD